MLKSSALSPLLRYAILTLLYMVLGTAKAATMVDYNRAKDQAFVVMSQNDSQKAIDLVIKMNTADDAMKIFMLMTQDLYWQSKDLAAALLIGRAGIQFGLAEARQAQSKDPARAYSLSSQAQILAYDLSSYCWHGWREEGINIPAVFQVYGQDLAKTNLRLNLELRKGNLSMSHAWWLIGAHQLAIGQYERARKGFVEATKFAMAAQTRETELLLKGYLYLAEMLQEPDNSQLVQEFEFVLNALDESREGEFFRDQLETAHAVFGAPLASDDDSEG